MSFWLKSQPENLLMYSAFISNHFLRGEATIFLYCPRSPRNTQVCFTDRMLSVEGEAAGLPWLKGGRNAHFGIRTTLAAWGSVSSLRCFHYFNAKHKATLQQICHEKSENRVLGATSQAAFWPTNSTCRFKLRGHLGKAFLLLPGCWRKTGFCWLVGCCF